MTEQKQCSKCGKTLPLTEFHNCARNKDGKYSSCRTCRKKSPTYKKDREWQIKQLYGLTIEQYNDMLEGQDSKCAICEKPFTKTPHVDHSHITGKVRGLLCRGCNIGIAHFEDNVKYLENAIRYLH